MPHTQKSRRPHMRPKHLFTILATLILLSSAAVAEPPNIIIIMADDMGYSDIGCYGSEIKTPNLDSLAKNGLQYTQFHNASRCCPTRASLMTGLYPHQAGVGDMVNDRRRPGYRGSIQSHATTIPKVLKVAGYTSYMTGKWHLGGGKHHPLKHGFDKFFGTITGAGNYYNPPTLMKENKHFKPKKGFYYTNAIAEEMINYLTQHKKTETNTPFFAYVAFTAPHWPLHALPEDIAKYKGVYDLGYDDIRKKRYQRMLEQGLLKKEWPLTPTRESWEKAKHKEWYTRAMEVYAAQVDNMDQNIGKLVKALKENGQFDNTLIFFLSDNGPSAEGNRTHPGNSRKFGRTLDGTAVYKGNDANRMPGPADTDAEYQMGWANVSATPFRLHKWFQTEGGTASPLIVHWPKGIMVKGKKREQVSHLIDLMATCVDVGGGEYPKVTSQCNVLPMEGMSLLKSFNTAKPVDRTIYFEHNGNKAIRHGRYKLLANCGKGSIARGKPGSWELFDMQADRTEMNDLSKSKPELVQELIKKWDVWAERTNVK